MGSTYSVNSSIDRKSLKKPDGFVTFITQFFQNLSGQTTSILIGVGVLFALALGVAFWMNHREAQSTASRSALFLAEKAYETELKAVAQSIAPAKAPTDKNKVPAQNEASLETVVFKPLEVDQKLSKSVASFKAVIEKYGKSRTGFEASLKLGKLYFNHGDYAQSLPWFQKAVDFSSGFEKAIALSSLGYAYENQGKTTEAIQAFEKSLQMGEGSLKGDLLLAIARCHEAAHDTAKARSTYDQVLKDLPNTEYSRTAETAKDSLQ